MYHVLYHATVEFVQLCVAGMGASDGLMVGLLIGFTSVGINNLIDDPDSPFKVTQDQKAFFGKIIHLNS